MKKIASLIILFLLYASVVYAGNATKAAIAGLAPGNWYRVTNETFCNVYCATRCQNCWHGKNPRWNPYAYSGGVYDSIMNRVIIWGGGHTDWGGNEVYAFDYNTCNWSRIVEPSPYSVIMEDYYNSRCNGDGYNSDGKPRQRHTRDVLVFDPRNNRMYFMDSNSLFSIQSGCGSHDAGYLDLSTDRWSPKGTVADCPMNGYRGKALYDSATGNIWMIGAQGGADPIYEYIPGANKWIKRYAHMGITKDSFFSSQAILDPVDRKIIFCGAGQYFTIDISNPASWTEDVGGGVYTGMPSSCIKKGGYTGDSTLPDWPSSSHPGFGLKYDPNTGLAFGWSSRSIDKNPGDIYILCPKTNHFIKLSPAPGSIKPKGENLQTIHGRFQVIWNTDQPMLSAIYMHAVPQKWYHYIFKLSKSRVDRDNPTVHFKAPGISASNIIPISSMSAHDPTSIIAGYAITTGPIPPKVYTSDWSDAPLTSFKVPSAGVYHLYAWAYDIYGNISKPVEQKVKVESTRKSVVSSQKDITKIRLKFEVPRTSTSTKIPILSMSATDSTSIIAGYAITTGPIPPMQHTSDWSAAPLTSFTVPIAGVYDLYAWAYDINGNISAPVVKTVEVECTTKTVASSGGDFTKISDAVSWANKNGPGSIIQIDARDNPWNSWTRTSHGVCSTKTTNSYDNVIGNITGNGITIRGINGVAKLDWLCGHAPTNAADDCGVNAPFTTNQAMVVIKNGVTNFRIENVQIEGVGYDGAAVRVEKMNGQLYIKGCIFNDNSYGGLLTGIMEQNLSVDIVNSKFYNNARFYVNGGQIHNIYVGEANRFSFVNSLSYDAYDGQLIKSRAKKNFILNSQLLDKGEGLCAIQGVCSNINLDLPYGGESYVIGNSFAKSAIADSPSFIQYNAEQRFTAYFKAGGPVKPRENSTVFTNTRTLKTWVPRYIYTAPGYGFKGSWAGGDKTGAIAISRSSSLYKASAPHLDIQPGDILTYPGGSITIVSTPAGGETVGKNLQYSWGISEADKKSNGIFVADNTFVNHWQKGTSPAVGVYTYYDRAYSIAKNNIFIDLSGSKSYPMILDAGAGTKDVNNKWEKSTTDITSELLKERPLNYSLIKNYFSK